MNTLRACYRLQRWHSILPDLIILQVSCHRRTRCNSMSECPSQRKSTKMSSQQCVIKRDSYGKDRRVCEESNLHVTRESRHQGLLGSRSSLLNMDELSDVNFINTSEDTLRVYLCSDRRVIKKVVTVYQGKSYDRVRYCMTLLEFHIEKRRSFYLVQSPSNLISSTSEMDHLRRHKLDEILKMNSVTSSLQRRTDPSEILTNLISIIFFSETRMQLSS